MKRYGRLWTQIIAFENLLQAAKQAQRQKRYRENVLEFNYNIESELLRLQHELSTQTYRPGPYRSFMIHDPKLRMISAAPYRDRVVHHAVCNVVVPLLERSFVRGSYANRTGYGTHRALKHFTRLARRHRYILQCDIRRYFPSIDHTILKTQLRRKLKCQPTLWLLDQIIDGSNDQDSDVVHFPGDSLLSPLERRRGLPIGNLTSQFFANFYLNGLDHFIAEKLTIGAYLRYVDDFALFSDSKPQLIQAQHQIHHYLASLRLRLHPAKTQIFETQHGVNFVGFRVLPDRLRVRNDNLYRARRRCKQLQKAYAHGDITLPALITRLQSWEAHLAHGDTYRLRQRIWQQLLFQRHATPNPSQEEN
ncbi:RNA-directed DNA polymerase [Prochlorothrix hollandica]|uniref:DNA polymerase n=1 Tax=Prochlorothrix hollandica PCC 9006 = CALU 1027 TaxID=317619 RepID=A0A0M2Q2X1_PROHO|nr:RNA-dependent DNA polymerase [Prochlorothrix hollandica]KKJ00942.1 DNA polymerase [Prochlorothrix hollandica PCC 9006 = CALU 1027]